MGVLPVRIGLNHWANPIFGKIRNGLPSPKGQQQHLLAAFDGGDLPSGFWLKKGVLVKVMAGPAQKLFFGDRSLKHAARKTACR
jgi:hypothetical protein